MDHQTRPALHHSQKRVLTPNKVLTNKAPADEVVLARQIKTLNVLNQGAANETHARDKRLNTGVNGPAGQEAKILIPALNEDGELFPVEKLQAHKEATHHLAISVFLFLDGKMLLQQRARDKYHSGGLWANACCTHPHWGESIEDSATRRLQEELGCSVELQAHGYLDYFADVGCGLTENERAHIFTGHIHDIDKQLKINLEEVRSIEVFDAETLKEKLEKQPGNFTAWFKEYMSREDAPLKSALEAGNFNWFK